MLLRLARSFLLLEDDYDVDWEVDQDEPARDAPHRAPLRGGCGAPPASRDRADACLCVSADAALPRRALAAPASCVSA